MKHYFLYLVCFCIIYNLSIPSHASPIKPPTTSYDIPYGSILSDIIIPSNVHIEFQKGPAFETIVNSIELSGDIVSLTLQSAVIKNHISLGDFTGTTSQFIGKNAHVYGPITLYGQDTMFQFGDGLVVYDAISLLGSSSNTFITNNAYITNVVSIGLSTSTNTLLLSNTILDNIIYIDGIETTILINENSSVTGSGVIDIFGNSIIYIDSALSSLDFLKFDTKSNHSLFLLSSFSYNNTNPLSIPLPDIVGNSLTLSGSSIVGDILVGENINIDVDWSNNTYFVGTIYTDKTLTNIRGIGFSNSNISNIDIPSSLPDNFILGLQDNTEWNGNIIGKGLDIGIVNSVVRGDIRISDGDVYSADSLITGNIIAVNSTITFLNTTLMGETTIMDNAVTHSSIHFKSDTDTAKNYLFETGVLTISPRVRSNTPLLYTANGIAGDTLTLSANKIEGYNNSMILFKGDVDISLMQADTFILHRTTVQNQYTIDYTATTNDIITSNGRIENVLQGFTQTPNLYRNTMNGYDIVLENNVLNSHNYDLVIKGYSKSNDAFSGATLLASMHTILMQDTAESQMMNLLEVLKSPRTKGMRGLSIWASTSANFHNIKESGYAKINTIISKSTFGMSTAPIDVISNIRTLLDVFIQYGYSDSNIYDIANINSSSKTHSIGASILSTWLIDIVANHSIFFSVYGGGSGLFTNIDRPYSNTFDKWKQYAIHSGISVGYIGKFVAFSITPYIGLNYNYLSSIEAISQDNTRINSEASNTMSSSIGVMADYTIYGFRPYIQTALNIPLPLSKIKVLVANVDRTYPTMNAINTDIALGLEYMRSLKSTQLSFIGEIALRTYLEKKPQYIPSVSLTVGISF